MASTTTTAWWIALYNCRDPTTVHTLTQSQLAYWFRIARIPHPPAPSHNNTVTSEWELFKAFVQGWLNHTLTPAHWTSIPTWTGRDLILDEILTRTEHPALTPTFVQHLQTNRSREPLAQAYRQIARIMMQERLRMPVHRPKFCTACPNVFQPEHAAQQCCPLSCRTSCSPPSTPQRATAQTPSPGRRPVLR